MDTPEIDYTKKISNENKKRNLESALYSFNLKHPFYAAFLSEITIEHTETIPTAALMYDKHKNEFKTLVNPIFFDAMSPEVRVAVLYHEVLHFTHGHLIRMELNALDPSSMTPEETAKFMEERQLKNIAADMAVNSFIPNLPQWAVKAENFKDSSGKPFPKFLTYEEYLELMKKHGDNKYNKNKKTTYKVMDEHLWESLSDEEKSRMLNKSKELVERTIEKTSNSFSDAKEILKGLIEQIETESAKLNYKNLLKLAIRNTITKSNRENTWSKPNRRYGVFAPGSKEAQVPRLNIYIDTSGSISHTEMNKFIKVIKNFLKVGANSANLFFWHTSIYHSEKIRNKTLIENSKIESGGTDITEVIEHINKNKPDLSIILSDGYFSMSETLNQNNVVWVISEEEGMNHPYKGTGKTVTLKGVI